MPVTTEVWRTIKLGLHTSPEAYYAAMKASDIKFSKWSEILLRHMICLPKETEIDLVQLSPADLGHKGRTNYGQFLGSALQDFEICPAETGPALRLQYMDQQYERLGIGMHGIFPPGEDVSYASLMFFVGQGDGLTWIDAKDARTGLKCGLEEKFVFVRPRQST